MSWSDWWSGAITGALFTLLVSYLGLVWYINTYGKCYKSFCLIPTSAIGIN